MKPSEVEEADADEIELADRSRAKLDAELDRDDGAGLLNRRGSSARDDESSGSADGAATALDADELLYDPRNCGYLLQYYAVGIIYGGINATLYGVFGAYFNVEGYVYTTIAGLVTFPWNFKVAFGALNDCRPILGYRRKSWMVVGWTMCALMCFVIFVMPLPEPYWCQSESGHYITTCSHAGDAARSPQYAKACGAIADDAFGDGAVAAAPGNAATQTMAGKYAGLLAVAATGYVIADVAADGLTVQYAQREPEAKRGKVQSTAYLVRACGFISSRLLVGFGMNTPEYSGTFEAGLGFQGILAIFGLISAAMAPVSWLYVREEKVRAPALRAYFAGVWRLMSGSAFFAAFIFSIGYPAINYIAPPVSTDIKLYWAGVQNFQSQIFGIVAYVIYAIGMDVTRKRLLNFSWRKMIVYTTVTLNVIDTAMVLLVVYAVVRNQYFYLGEDFILEIPSAIKFLVTTFYVVEAADGDNGGIVYGALTTAHNIGAGLSTPISNQIFQGFKPSLSDPNNFVEDSDEFRNTVAASIAVGLLAVFVALVFLPLLPNQKAEAQSRKHAWPSHPRYAFLTAAIFLGVFVYAILVSVLTMIPSTSCLEFVGGDGCDD